MNFHNHPRTCFCLSLLLILPYIFIVFATVIQCYTMVKWSGNKKIRNIKETSKNSTQGNDKHGEGNDYRISLLLGEHHAGGPAY